MALLGYQQAKIAGTALNYVAATGDGDTIPPNDRGMLLVRNAGAGSVTVTVAVPGSTKYGQANPDVAVAVAAGADVAVGPFPADLADPASGHVGITYSAVASVTVAAAQI